MFDRVALNERIGNRLAQALQECVPVAKGLISITLPLPEVHLDLLPEIDGEWYFWGRPHADEYLFGLGCAQAVTAAGTKRFGTLAEQFDFFRNLWQRADPENCGIEPALFCGFAFDPDDPMPDSWQGFPNAGLFFPELLLQQQGRHCAATFFATDVSRPHETVERWSLRLAELLDALTRIPEPAGSRTTLARIVPASSEPEWLRLVNLAVDEIRRGGLENVVPSRRIRVRAERPLEPARLLAALDFLYPNNMLFAARRGDAVFAAATPERLISRSGSRVICDAIAGTARRAALPQQDDEYGRRLLHDPKAQHEHRLVVQSVVDALQPLCETVSEVPAPDLMRLRNLQHLWTEITGSGKDGVGLLQLAAHLHPTAAVNGVPRQAAAEWLRRNEPPSRGWYTGSAGWMNAKGDGTLAVLLRCALLQGEEAELFAGAGITAGSEPQAELEETELKFGAMLEALENA
jgi:isochorismate synthase